jgi:carbon storage regulator
MLVLTRRPGESIIIGKNLIKVKVLNSNDYSVRIGIDAPKDISVHREEIYHCIENGTSKEVEGKDKREIKCIDESEINHINDDDDRFNK